MIGTVRLRPMTNASSLPLPFERGELVDRERERERERQWDCHQFFLFCKLPPSDDVTRIEPQLPKEFKSSGDFNDDDSHLLFSAKASLGLSSLDVTETFFE